MRAKIAIVMALAVTAGCASLPSEDVFELEDGKAVLASVSGPHESRLGVAVAMSTEKWSQAQEDFGNAARITVDGTALRKRFGDHLRRLGLFAAVEEIGDENVLDRDGLYIEAARDQNLDFVLVLRPTKARVTYEGHNGNFVPSLALWVLFWFPSWWVADEDFASEVALHGTLYRASDGREIHRGDWAGKFETALDDFDRNWRFWGIVRGASALSVDDYEDVGKLLAPHAYNLASVDLMRDLVAVVGAGLPPSRPETTPPPVDPAPSPGGTGENGTTPDPGPQDPPVQPEPPAEPSRRAIVIGVSKYSAGLPEADYTRKDAVAFADALKKHAGFTDDDIELLTGEAATLDAVKTALKSLSQAPVHPKDVTVVYFSGRGLAQKGASAPRLFLGVRDTVPDDLTLTGLILTDLREALLTREGKVRVILDTSFSGGNAGRSFGQTVAGADKALDAIFGDRKGWACLYAAGEGGGAASLSDVSHGLATHFLIDGLDGGKTGIRESSDHLAENVPVTADFLGERQSPAWIGKDVGGKVLPSLAAR